MGSLLQAVHRHPRWAWACLLIYAALVTFPHENVQWLVNEIAIRISHKRLYRTSAAIALIEAALFTVIIFKRIARQPARRVLAAFWVLTIVLIWGAWRLFTANNVELVHYPQYVPEGMALLALTLSPAESLAWIAIFGGFDECFQYAVLNKTRAVPFDFNDIYMDLLGGAAGVLLAMAWLHCDRQKWPSLRVLARPGVMLLLAILFAGVLLWSSGLMLLYQDPSNHHAWFALSREKPASFLAIEPMNGPNKYHTLSPIEGPLLILVTIAVYSALDRAATLRKRGPTPGWPRP